MGAPNVRSARAGEVLDRQFRLERLLGEGGMGEVYLAEQVGMGRWAVIKLLHPHLVLTGQAFRERFEREARAVAQLNHPNIVQIYASGQTADGVPYLAMEYVQGRTLKEVLAQAGALPESRVLHIMRQVCGALHEAHGRGIVHRDLKPENIMVLERHGDADFVKLLDFGIAKLGGESEARLTQSGMVFGTPHYMAPEQIRGESVDPRTDVYALGLILYELLAGQPAVAGDSTFDVLTRQVNETPPRLAARGVRISAAIEAAMFRCLEKEPPARWPSVAQLGQALGPASSDALAVSDHVANDGRTVSLPSEHGVSMSGPRPKLEPARRRRKSRRVQRADDESWHGDSSEHLNYYEMLPLPRFLKPYAPWIVSITSVILMAVFSIVMQQCSYRRLGHVLRRVDHAMSSE